MSHLRLVHSTPRTAARPSSRRGEQEIEIEDADDSAQALSDSDDESASVLRMAALEIERPVPGCSQVARDRAMARARAALTRDALGAPRPASRARPRFYLGAAVSLVVGIGMGVALASLHQGRERRAVSTAMPELAPELASRNRERVAPATIAPRAPEGEDERKGSPPSATPALTCTTEVECLKRVWKAYARRDYRAALASANEHRRRFPKGLLREEREALRVLSLDGAGHTEEARRAGAAFGERFPGSVLFPKISKTMDAD